MKIIRQRTKFTQNLPPVALFFPGAVSVVWVTLGNNLAELQHICVRLQLMQFSVWKQQYMTWRHVLCIAAALLETNTLHKFDNNTGGPQWGGILSPKTFGMINSKQNNTNLIIYVPKVCVAKAYPGILKNVS